MNGVEATVAKLQGREAAKAKTAPKFDKWDSAYDMAISEETSIPWVVTDLLPRTGIAVVYGSPDTGKSTLLRQLCLSVVAGEKWAGFKTNPTHKRAAYISTEDDIDSLNFIIKKQINAMGYDKAHCKNVYFLFQAGDVLEELTKLLVKATENDTPFDLIIIDCWSDIFNLNNSQANQVRVFLANFHDLARTYKTLIIFNHHSKKEIEHKAPHKNNVSGVGLVSKARLAIEFRNDPLDQHKRHLCVVKGNYLKDSMKVSSTCLSFKSGFHFDKLDKEGVEFESLAISADEKIIADENMYIDAKASTQDATAEKYGVDQSTVSRAIKRHEKRQLLTKS